MWAAAFVVEAIVIVRAGILKLRFRLLDLACPMSAVCRRYDAVGARIRIFLIMS